MGATKIGKLSKTIGSCSAVVRIHAASEQGFTAMPALFLLALVVGILFWVLASSADRNRIAEYIQQHGGRVVSIAYAPFGKGWFGEKNDRIYEVVYYDNEGNQHFASCKTSMWSGVYWTEDRITYPRAKWVESLSPGNAPGRPVISQIPQTMPPPPVEPEAEELMRLREENARLRERLGMGAGGMTKSEIRNPNQ